jgi:hypothetical protein
LLKSHDIELSRYQIAELYMVFGGIPYYLDYVNKGVGPAQNIDRTLFVKNAPLSREFDDLYASLFKKPEKYKEIVAALGNTPGGLTRDELLKKTGQPSGSQFTKALLELEQCGFIEATSDFTRNSREMYYKLIDFFTLFYLRHVQNNTGKDDRYWQNRSLRGEQNAWYGLAFERLCKAHVAQIKQRLGILGISTQIRTWRSRLSKPAAQIDLVIDRNDNIVNLCEIKFSAKPFTVEAAYDTRLRERLETFREETGTSKALHTILITATGVTQNSYLGEVQMLITLDDLFMPIITG